MENIDVAIIGAGPGGVTASIYLKRAGVDFILFESMMVGGKVNSTAKIDNYPPFLEISGFDLSMKYMDDLSHNDIKVVYQEVLEVIKEENFIIKTKKETYVAKCVLICSGTKNKYLGFTNEDKYIQKGISTCAICDGNLFKGQNMAVVGGGNSALEEALYLANIASKVYIIHRRNEFRGNKQYVNSLLNNEKIEFLTPYVIKKAEGDHKIRSLILENVETHENKEIKIEVLFEYVGLIPNINFLKIDIDVNEGGFINVNNDMETSVKGLFACGDVTSKNLRQIIVSSGDAALASQSIIHYLQNLAK